MSIKKVLIVGGGFAGIKAALELGDDPRFAVTLLSDRPNFRYYPTLYHIATGGSVSQANIPLAQVLAEHKITIGLGEAKHLERNRKHITTTTGMSYSYDILILALGVVTNYFGIKGLQEYSYSIKSIEEASRFKQHLHRQLIDEHKPDLNYIIVGGGPTGIELAGVLPAYLRRIMKQHGIEHRAIHIDLVEAAPRLMPRMPKRMSKAIARRLRDLGVKLYLGQTVQGETASSLNVNGRAITSHTVVWTAGVTNHPFFQENHFKLNDRGKVAVDTYLQAESDIFVLGDNADTPYSGMAQTALYDGIYISRILKEHADSRPSAPYQPKKPIYVIPAGPKWAAVLWGKTQLYGRLGWLMREMADLAAFHDYEPWWEAGKQWMSEFDEQEDCPICQRTA